MVCFYSYASDSLANLLGCLTQFRLFKESAVVKTPSYLSDTEACNFQIAGTTAWMAVNGMRPLGQPGGSGETILVQGTGGVSIMGLLIAKASGARGESLRISAYVVGDGMLIASSHCNFKFGRKAWESKEARRRCSHQLSNIP